MSIFQMFWYLGKVQRCLLVSSLFWPFIVSRCFQQWKNESVARGALRPHVAFFLLAEPPLTRPLASSRLRHLRILDLSKLWKIKQVRLTL